MACLYCAAWQIFSSNGEWGIKRFICIKGVIWITILTIVSGKMKSWKIWEDEILAFLTFRTRQVYCGDSESKVIVFSLDDNLYSKMMLAVKKVAGIFWKSIWYPRVALIFEGTGVAHVRAELICRFMRWFGKGELVRQCRTSKRGNILVGSTADGQKWMMLNWMKFSFLNFGYPR